MKYILQREIVCAGQDVQYGRRMIDTEYHAGFEPEESIEASCWIEAKKLLGFHLTVLQELMLAQRKKAA